MKALVACYSVLNEGAFLRYSLRSVLPHVDRVVIVEGAYQNHVKANNNSEYSIDNTIDIIDEFRHHPKVSAIHASEPTQMRQRARYLEYLNSGDVMFMVDGDEIYQRSHINWLHVVFREYPRYHWMSIKHIAFSGDLCHYYKDYPYYKKGRVTAVRYSPDLNYRQDGFPYDVIHLWDKNGAGQSVMKKYNGLDAPINKCVTYHARFLKPNYLQAIKASYYHLNDPNMSSHGKKASPENIVARLRKTNLSSVPSTPYNSPIPSVLKDHPLRRL